MTSWPGSTWRQVSAVGAPPLIAAAVTTDSIVERTLVWERAWTLGLLALAEGRHDEAVNQLRQAAEKVLCTSCVYPDLGRALEAAGRSREAVDAYQHYLSTPWLWRYEPDAMELGWVLKRLAELHEQLGNRPGAREAWQRLLALWDKADPALQPILETAKAKVAALK